MRVIQSTQPLTTYHLGDFRRPLDILTSVSSSFKEDKMVLSSLREFEVLGSDITGAPEMEASSVTYPLFKVISSLSNKYLVTAFFVPNAKYVILVEKIRDTWAAQSDKCLTLDFSSGSDLRVLGLSHAWGSTRSTESTCPSPSAPPVTHALSLALPLG